MGARTKARKRALDLLFEADQRGANANSILDQRILVSGRETPLPPYAIEIVKGVVSRWVELNAIIQDASPSWTMARMPGIDRALLRIATWEILCNDEVPTSVAINEAVALAKVISTDNSASFINGLLSTIAKDAPALSHASADDAAGSASASYDAAGYDNSDYDDVESVDGAAIFDSLGDDDADEPEADADFADAGLSDELAKEWAERLLADDEATVVRMPESDQIALAEAEQDAPVETGQDLPTEADQAAPSSAAEADEPAKQPDETN